MTEKTIKVTAKQITGTTANGKNYDFLEFTGATNKGMKCKFKFTKACRAKLPDKAGVYDMRVNLEDISRDNNTIFNEYWVRDVIEIKPTPAQLSKLNRAKTFKWRRTAQAVRYSYYG